MKHHYVPVFLQRAWAGASPDRKVEVFRLDLDGIPSSRRCPKYTGYEEDLWALSKDQVAGMSCQALEKLLFSRIDNDAAIVRRKLEEQGLRVLTSDDRENWARFLMSLRLRQPDLVRTLKDESAEQLRTVLGEQPEQYEKLAGCDDPPSLVEWTEKKYPGLIENFGLSFFAELGDIPEVGISLMRMKWWIWDFSATPHDLVLADNPCIFTSGITDPNLIVALPISPKKAFLAIQTGRVSESLRRQNRKTLVQRINESSVLQACVRIYARDKSPARFIRNRRFSQG